MCGIKALSFYIGGECYAADVALVQKAARKLRVSAVPTAPPEVTGITNLSGKTVTVLNIGALVYETRGEKKPIQILNAVVFKSFSGDGDRMGLAIDRPGGLIEFGDENISPLNLRHIKGAVENEGVIYRIIDVGSIINRYREGDKHV